MIRAYLRVSTEDQAESGLGIERHRAAILRHCQAHGEPEPVWYADEGLSGTLPPVKRPDLLRLLGDVAKGDVVLVAERRALARGVERSVLIEHELKRKGGRLVCIGERDDEDEYSATLRRLMEGVLDEMEVLRARLRTKAALACKRARGEPMGRPPFGWVYDTPGGRLLPDPAQQKVIAWIVELSRCGLTTRQIVAELAARQISSPTGKPQWSPSSVSNVLRSAAGRGSAAQAS